MKWHGLGLVLLVLAGAAAGAKPGSPALTARPAAEAVNGFAAGKIALGGGAMAYVPESAITTPRPVLVLLHGAGGKASTFLDRFTTLADRERLVLLAVQSRGPTWDLVPRNPVLGDGPLAMKSPRQLRFGKDVERVDAALTELFARKAADPGRIVLIGFSDGASYALSLGLANPQLFAGIVALSPGFVVVPGTLSRTQRIFISHGRNDKVLSFNVAEQDILGLLVEVGLKPLFRPFDGEHMIDSEALSEGLAFALGPAPQDSRL